MSYPGTYVPDQPDFEYPRPQNSRWNSFVVPTSQSRLEDFFKEKTKLAITHVASYLVRHHPRAKLHPDDDYNLGLLLGAWESITINKRLYKHVQQALNILGDWDPNRSQFRFPPPYPERAEALRDKIEAELEANEKEVVDEVEDVDDVSGATESRPSKSQKAQAQAIANTAHIRIPHKNHPIYGEQGIMRGVLLKGTAKRTYLLNGAFPRGDYKAYGNNGFTVGDWWPFQLCALRDGVHGVKMGGIAGNLEFGAYSVVVSGGKYEDLDKDCGDIIYYSGSSPIDDSKPVKKGSKPEINVTRATQVMQRSVRVGRPVRVLRQSSGRSKFAPTVGLRYDGLYKVTAEKDVQHKDFVFKQFTLERLGGQLPIDQMRPTHTEKTDFGLIAEGY